MNNNFKATYEFDSSVIAYAEYNYETQNLSIDVSLSGIYNYANVPYHTFNGLVEARSKGKFFNKFIKNNFKFKK
jgi:lysyl-tRNA synthetase, class II